MMRFIYTGKAPNLDKMADSLLAAADKVSNCLYKGFIGHLNETQKVFVLGDFYIVKKSTVRNWIISSRNVLEDIRSYVV